jgi:NADH-ubiquinone oxidoreductase chain 6
LFIDKTKEKKLMFSIYVIPDLYNGYSLPITDIIAVISIFSGIFIIISKNPVVSVLFLILLFSSISCYLIIIGIKFIGLSYLLVYVGAVSILFLFILMLINIRVSELISDTSNNIPLAILAILAFFIPFSDILPKAGPNVNEFNLNTFSDSVFLVSSNNWEGNIVDVSDIMSIGNIMYTSYSIWLILTSIILLLAMVGSIVITIKQKN